MSESFTTENVSNLNENQEIHDDTAIGVEAAEEAPTGPRKINDAIVVGDPSEAAMAIPLKLGFGKHREDKKLVIKEMTYIDLITGLSKHVIGDKDGPGFIQGSLMGKERRALAVDALYVMGLDIDSGIHPEPFVKRVQEMGLTCIAHTTHSNWKATTYLTENSYIRFCKKNHIEVTPNEYDEATVQRYFIEEKSWESWIVATIEIGDVVHTTEGKGVWINHEPMPKFRAIFPLAKPFVIAEHYGSQNDAIALWKRKLVGLSNMVGVPIDMATLDPSRLFYLPRHPKGKPFGVWVTGGDALDFAAIPEGKAGGVNGGAQKPTDTYARNGEELAGKDGPDFVIDGDFSLKKWAAQKAAGFDVASMVRAVAPGLIRNDQNTSKITIACPFDHFHSNAGNPDDPGCYVETQSPENGKNSFTFACSHTSCKGRDRLEFIAEAVNQGWFTKDDLDNDDFQLFVIEETKEEKLAKLQKEVEATVTPDTGNSDLDGLFTKLAALSPSPNQVQAIIDAINDKRGVPVDQKAQRNKLRTYFNDNFLKKADAARLKQKKADDQKKQLLEPGKGGKPKLCVDVLGFMPCVEAAAQRVADINATTPTYFDLGGQKVIVEKDGSGNAKTIPLDKGQMKAQLNRVCDWINEDGVSVYVHPEIVGDMIEHTGHKFLSLERVSSVPFFAADDTLVSKEGYYASANAYCVLPKELAELTVDPEPTKEQVDDAVNLYLDDLFHDFPFNDKDGTGDASRANLLAMALEPYVRDLIDGPTPFYLCDKAQPRTGGSLAVEVAMYPALGKAPAGEMWPMTDPDEQRKLVTARLMEAPPFFYIDNIDPDYKFEGAILAMLTTLPVINGRVLGSSKMASMPNRCTKVGTGNKVHTSIEIGERIVPIRLAFDGDPTKRDPNKFKHPKLRAWAADNRVGLVRGALTIIQAWIAAGKPEPTNVQPFSGFEGYVKVMGGILEHANVKGFLANRRLARETYADDSGKESALYTAWLMEYGPDPREIGNPDDDAAKGGMNIKGKGRTSIPALAEDFEIDLNLPIDKAGWQKRDACGAWLSARVDVSFEIAPGLDVMLRKCHKGKQALYGLECVGYQPEVATDLSRVLWVTMTWNQHANELLAIGSGQSENLSAWEVQMEWHGVGVPVDAGAA